MVTFKRNADLIFKLKFLCREECPYDSIEKFERQRSSVRPSVHIFKSVTFEKHESNGLLFCSMIQHFWWMYSFVFENKKCRNRHLQTFNFLHFPLQLPYCYFRHFQQQKGKNWKKKIKCSSVLIQQKTSKRRRRK